MTNDGRIAFELTSSLAAASFIFGLWVRQKELAPRKWPRASGKILVSDLEPQRRQVLPIIEYEFDYNSQTIRSSHWRIGNILIGNPESAAAIKTKYFPGASASVYVNTSQPMKSVLEYGVTFATWTPMLFGSGFLLLSLIFLLLG